MPLIVTDTQKQLTAIIPAGSYVARCVGLVQVGTTHGEYLGQEKTWNKVRLTFELPTELHVFKEENGEQPSVISQEYSLSLHEKSTMRKVFESWRGKTFTADELEGFDVLNVVGKPCMLNIIHTTKGEKTFPEIASISPVPKGLKVPPQINPSKILTYTDWDQEIFDTLPQWLQNRLESSDEYQAMHSPHSATLPQNEPLDDTTESVEDDPFADAVDYGNND